jgi:regulator of PEP synthase PpsR (kinase-PPPase family)
MATEHVVPVFFLSGSTGISAETMGNVLLIQFPDLRFERRLFPFITTREEARRVVAILDAAMDGPVTPLVFSTAAVDEIREVLLTTRCPIIDFFGMHLERVEETLGVRGMRVAARPHGMGDVHRYNNRMQAIEFAMEHDDGQSLRALDKAEVILLAPSRCGKTPTTMYLALQHGIFVANYPIVDEDFESVDLPRPLRKLRDRCFGILTTPERLSQVRTERREASRYASLAQCTHELRRAEAMFRLHKVPTINSSASSVEEMATVILQQIKGRHRQP